jgi:glycosyltransferase involved in cell wall biosynthesis
VEGISVIICSHNGALRLPTTLAHLVVQQPLTTPWEVVLVDNASTDNSAEVARACWRDGPAPLRVVEEPRLGVRFARELGLATANYGFVGFVDDDNWVANDWVRTAYSIMSSNTRLGALGSIRTPVCEVSQSIPAWFENVHSAYAILTDGEFEQMEEPPPYLPTAGLCVRKAAWETLVRNGFRQQLVGRQGKSLSAGEDTELTMSLRLTGWELRIDPRLRLQHFMPGNRLRWRYARRLLRSHSASHVLLDAYSERSMSLRPGFRRWLSERWWYQFGSSVGKMTRQPRGVLTALLSSGDGREDVVEIELLFGRALGLLRHTNQYGRLRREVREAPWRALPGLGEASRP